MRRLTDNFLRNRVRCQKACYIIRKAATLEHRLLKAERSNIGSLVAVELQKMILFRSIVFRYGCQIFVKSLPVDLGFPKVKCFEG